MSSPELLEIVAHIRSLQELLGRQMDENKRMLEMVSALQIRVMHLQQTSDRQTNDIEKVLWEHDDFHNQLIDLKLRRSRE